MTRAEWSLLLTLSLLWGGSFLFVELALRGLPPLTIVLGRVGLAALLLGGVLALRRGCDPASGDQLPRRAWGAALVMGLLNNAIPFTLFVLAQGRIDSALAAIVNATTPLWTVVVAHLFTADERITPAKAIGLVFGFAGVAVMAGRAGGGEAIAILACLGAALSYGLAAVWGRRFRRMGIPPLATAFGQTAGGGEAVPRLFPPGQASKKRGCLTPCPHGRSLPLCDPQPSLRPRSMPGTLPRLNRSMPTSWACP